MAYRFARMRAVIQRGRRQLACLVLLASLSIVLSWYESAHAREWSASPEYAIKAAFLYNFTKFIEWPEDTFKDEDTPFRLCVLGEDPFGAALDSVRAKNVKGRPMEVLRIDVPEHLQGCQMAFISVSMDRQLGSVTEVAAYFHVLTVGDSDHFARHGGIIQLVRVGDKIRFEINLDAAKRAGLRISSKLLRLARAIVQGRHGRYQ